MGWQHPTPKFPKIVTFEVKKNVFKPKWYQFRLKWRIRQAEKRLEEMIDRERIDQIQHEIDQQLIKEIRSDIERRMLEGDK